MGFDFSHQLIGMLYLFKQLLHDAHHVSIFFETVCHYASIFSSLSDFFSFFQAV